LKSFSEENELDIESQTLSFFSFFFGNFLGDFLGDFFLLFLGDFFLLFILGFYFIINGMPFILFKS